MNRCKSLEGALDSYLSDHLGLSTGYRYLLARAVAHFARWHRTPILLATLRRETIIAFMRAELAEGLSAVTVNGKRRALLTLLRAARLKVGRVPRVPEPIGLPQAWTLQECESIFSACATLSGHVGSLSASDWWLSLTVAIYYTGERIKAMRSIRSADCDLSVGTLIVRARSHKSRADRLLWIPEQAAELIQRIHDPRRELLWPWPSHRNTLFKQFRRIIEAAGVPCPRGGHNLFRRLRRTTGTLVEAAGGDGARMLGNSRAVFERYYLDPRMAAKSQARLLPTPHL